jgi:wyosine [tRNA(Phe)-imidazoG37] synthetase (radical SAM superfamily)
VAVLTNGSLLENRQVRESLMQADAVLPSLDAHDEEGFQTINRPHPEIRLEGVLEGLTAFRKDYSGQMWLEVFILDGINATPSDATQFKQHIENVDPQKVHINTAVRPTAEAYARQVPAERITGFCSILGQKAEVIAPFKEMDRHERRSGVEEDLLSLLARRPCTLEDISSGLNVNRNEILKQLDALLKEHTIETIEKDSKVYYQPKKPL